MNEIRDTRITGRRIVVLCATAAAVAVPLGYVGVGNVLASSASTTTSTTTTSTSIVASTSSAATTLPPTTASTSPAPTTAPAPTAPATAAPATAAPTTAVPENQPLARPGRPQSVHATAAGNSADISWGAPTDGGPVAEYKVQLSTDNSDWRVLSFLPASARSFHVSGLEPGTRYHFRVFARNETGFGKVGETSVVTTGASAAAPPSTTTPPSTAAPVDGGQRCAPAAYPTDSCAGAPSGDGLRLHEGDLKVREPGTVIDGWRITGRLIVETTGVVIRNSVILGGVQSGWQVESSFTIEDSTVGHVGACNDGSAIGSSNFTARRVRVVGFSDGFRVSGSNVTIQDSYATMCQSGCSHSDGVQAVDASDATNIVIEHNVLDMRAVADPCATTCPIFLPTHQNPGISATINNNVLAGGEVGLCIYEDSPGTFASVTGNLVVEGSTESVPVAVHCPNVGEWHSNAVITYDWVTGQVLLRVRELNDCV